MANCLTRWSLLLMISAFVKTSTGNSNTDRRENEPETSRRQRREGIFSGQQQPTCKRLVCYFPFDAKTRIPPGTHTLKDVDPSLCTHIILRFTELKDNKLTPSPEDRIVELKNHPGAGNLKVMTSVGGWYLQETIASIIATKENRKNFAINAVEFLRNHAYDGIELDWLRRSTPEQKKQFSLLLEEMDQQFRADAEARGMPKLLLTAFVSPSPGKIDQMYEVNVLNQRLDFINIMTYNYHGAWELYTGHVSPLLGASESDPYHVAQTLKDWADRGASKDKLVVGLTSYSRSFTLDNKAKSTLGAKASKPGKAGSVTKREGFLAYYEVCMYLQKPETKKYFIDRQRVPYLVYGDQWVGYEDQDSLREKVKYVLGHGYGGFSLVDTSTDDAKGLVCRQGKYPLLTAINKACGID